MKKGSKPQEINGLIFRELIKRGYSLDGNTRIWDVSDSKLWYLKPYQAQAYLDLLDSQDYKSGFAPKEEIMINENIQEIVDRVGDTPLNIIDLGCGDGRKAVKFIEEIGKKTKVRYCPIDISAFMVKKAIENISKLNQGVIVKSQWNISDFENLENVTNLISDKEYPKSLFLLLGNTLSNFEFHDLLYQIRTSMKSGDSLVIGNGIENETVEEDMVRFTTTNKYNNEFLVKIPEQLGFNQKDIKLNVRFKNHRVEFYYDIQKDYHIKFGGREVRFQKGDQIVVAVSYHYSKEDFTGFLNIYFDEVITKFSDDGSYGLAFCKK
ncbi:MAG: L-histidine N(alpha)-methyltransferase [archaeon]|nr:L-histidine N(alpha)-methyltransferase [archaeon]MCR4323510.1 L-histidine N(alpha)-methyltransferase [Nanoarchaeota archaeon]